MEGQHEFSFGDHLEVVSADGQRAFRCSRCRHDMGPVSQNYKMRTMVIEGSIVDANPLVGDPARFIDDEMVLRQYLCPGCMTLLDNEINRAGEPPLWDIELR
jgi:N-methylhydantoinase B